MGFSEIHAELTNLSILPNFLPNLPNFVKIKNPLNLSKYKILNFISFLNTLS